MVQSVFPRRPEEGSCWEDGWVAIIRHPAIVMIVALFCESKRLFGALFLI